MKKWLITALLIGCLSSLAASPYAKVGSEPSLGGGIRQSIGHHGADLSLDVAPFHDEKVYSAKSLYLFYPEPEKKARVYFGGGVGGVMREQQFPNYTVWKEAKKERTLEAVAGCEFLQNDRMKMYTQVEGSFPRSRSPEVRFTLGLGF